MQVGRIRNGRTNCRRSRWAQESCCSEQQVGRRASAFHPAVYPRLGGRCRAGRFGNYGQGTARGGPLLMGSSALKCSAQLGGPCVTTRHCGCRIGRCAVDVSSSAGGSGMLSACRGGCAICRHLQGRPCRAPARPGQLAWPLRFPQQWWESAAVGCCAPGGHLPGGHDFQWPASVFGEGPLNAELLMRVPLGVGTGRRLALPVPSLTCRVVACL